MCIGLSAETQAAVGPLLAEVETLNEGIAAYQRQIEQLAKEHYPEIALLKQLKRVGTLIALTFVLTVDDPHRFRAESRCGLLHRFMPGTPQFREESTTNANQQVRRHPLKIADGTRAHYILGPFGRL